MDNGAYAQYRKENPVVNTLLSTYDEIDAHVGTLTNVQLGIYIIFGVLTA